ncbi:MAG: hypothetical protein WCL39_09275, partial [Armatimonadota bacterium]
VERYALAIPLAPWASVKSGEKSDDGKYLRWVQARTPGGTLGLTANFVDVLGAGAGISAERRESMGNLTSEDILEYMRSSGTDLFEPHKYLAATKDTTATLDLLTGGINPPQDGTQWALNPDVHRLFYRGMGRTFDGALIVNPVENEIADELDPIYFEVPPDYYSEAGALPEDGDPVEFGEFKDLIFNAAEWMLKRQWRGTLWWGEWWREYDVFRKQGIEATANGNNPLGPLFHYWRTGDTRFIDCAKRAMEYEYDIQLCKKGSTSPVPFFHSRRYLMDQMEWVHMRYQRIEGPIKAAHFFGDRRLRTKIIDAMRAYSEVMVLKDGGPGFWENDKRKVSLAGSDCTNFGEVLGICYKETGEEHFLDKAKRMANWTIRVMNKWDWDAYIGNSYGWHFLMRGMLSTLKLTGNKRYKDWYIDMARRNLTYDLDEMDFRPWMDWLLAEAGRLSPKDESWFLDEMKRRTICKNSEITPEGAVFDRCNYPWSKFPSLWQRLYDQKTIVCYIPVLIARRKALGMEP